MPTPILIGIAGGSGSGKTYLAHQVQMEAVEEHVSVLSMDQYFKTDGTGEDPANINFDHPGRLNFGLMVSHIRRLKSGHAITAPSYDFHKRVETAEAERIPASPVVIVEGLFILAEPVVNLFDLTCFLDVAADERLLGRIVRDTKERGATIESIIDRYQRFVRPSYQVFVAPTAQNADVVVDFTYRRTLFTALLVHVIRDYVTHNFDLNQLVTELRKEQFSLGFKPEEGSMPFSTDIFALAKAFPETSFPSVDGAQITARPKHK